MRMWYQGWATRFYQMGKGLSIMSLLGWYTLAGAAPKAELWPRWQQNDPHSTLSIDHALWQQFLTKYLIISDASRIYRLNYAALTPADRQLLSRYLGYLQSLSIDNYHPKTQKAYWINLYNALTIKVVLEHYPIKSIRDIDISPGFFNDGPWDAKLLKVVGESLSLNDIEHRILRPIWQDNRVHYALNCASLGCPNLAPLAYTAENTEQLLEQSAREYINHPRGAFFQGDTLRVSKIYQWYQEDFEDSELGVLRHLRQYAIGELAQKLKTYEKDFDTDYDWALNAPGTP